jgi:hypothetical protein
MENQFADFPCGSHCQTECEIRAKMISLQQSLTPPPVDQSAVLMRTFFPLIVPCANHRQQ